MLFFYVKQPPHIQGATIYSLLTPGVCIMCMALFLWCFPCQALAKAAQPDNSLLLVDTGTPQYQLAQLDEGSPQGQAPSTAEERQGVTWSPKPQPRKGSNGFFSGSFIGAALFGQPYTGIGMPDVLVLSLLILFGLRGFTSKNSSGPEPHERNTHDTGHTDAGRSQQGPPLRPIEQRAKATWDHLRSAQTKASPQQQSTVQPGADTPQGFDANDFLNGARMLYSRLQTSFAARDLNDLEPFTTVRMMTTLRTHAAADPAPRAVEILLVTASLLKVEQIDTEEHAEVLFNALMSSGSQNAAPQKPVDVQETWSFVRGPSTGGTWRLDAIA